MFTSTFAANKEADFTSGQNSMLEAKQIEAEYSNDDVFVLEAKEAGIYKITGVKSSFIEETELRVYYQEDCLVNEIDEHAFDLCTSLNTFMLSKSVVTVPNNLFSSIDGFRVINYTGSEIEFNLLNLTTTNISVNYYACDEGFINYWYTYIRPTENANICDTKKEDYKKVQDLYNSLSQEDKNRVKSIPDGESTILDSLNFLNEYFKESGAPQRNKEASKDVMIALILGIATLGMTFICVFYILKERNIIK